MLINKAALGLAGLLLAQPLSAFGQVVLPIGAQPSEQPSTLPVLSPTAAEALMAPVEVDPDLRRLPASRLAMRLEGETASREWPVYLTTAQAAAPAQLQIGYMNAVSVMPEGSSLIASINDVEIGQITIAAAEIPARARLDVPPGLLQPGYNAIRIRATQRHRVDCSLAGTYELWTELQPGITGLAFLAETKGFETFADIAAVNPAGDGAVHIRIRTADTRNPALVARMLRVAEQAALAAGAAHVVVDVDPAPADGPGMEIAVGTPSEIAALGVLKAGQAAAPGVSLLLPEGMDLVQSRVTVLVSGANEAEIDRALASLDAQIRSSVPVGTPAGLRALANLKGYTIAPGTPVTFRDLGVSSEDFNGRLYRASMQVRMPYDYLSADYNKAELRLVAGYVPGLGGTSQLIVRVNGETASVLPLPRKQGEIMRGREIPIPLRALHPGVNRVELEAHLASPADESCDALAAMNAPSRFILMNDSELFVPRVARLAQMPDLASTMGAGFPYTGTGRMTAFIPHPDRETLGAAATFAANMAAGAGAPLGLSVAFSAPPPDAGTALVIGAMRDLPPAVLSAYGLSADSMQQAWRGQLITQPAASIDQLLKEPNFTASTARELRLPAANPPAPQPQGFNTPTVSLDDWSHDIRSRGESHGFATRAWNWIRGQVGLSRQHLGVYAGAETVRVKPETTLVVAQIEAPFVAGETWTLVTAPTGERLSASVAEIADPALSYRVQGQAVAFNADDGSIATSAGGASYFIATQDLSFRNLRLIAAGWFSLNIAYYVLSLVAACCLLGTATWLFVRRIGHGDQ